MVSETIVGGTGGFAKIRGTLLGAYSFDPARGFNTGQWAGDYWLEQWRSGDTYLFGNYMTGMQSVRRGWLLYKPATRSAAENARVSVSARGGAAIATTG
jgi:hypothetical protein